MENSLVALEHYSQLKTAYVPMDKSRRRIEQTGGGDAASFFAQNATASSPF
ncbi:protein of unknown function [Shinella sp. WSC3-e]|nr:hypothetical protein SHINE37_41097 [Rhizobiaceae bacterium]CAK7255746.1 protein of unknown function [Shinella sp. WSC3-e]